MLKEIKTLLKYKEMLKNNVQKELRARYKGSILGFLWTFVNPLLMLIVYTIVFSTILQVRTEGQNFSVFLFVGLVPWIFLSNSIAQCSTVVISNANLIKKIYFPRILLPISAVITNLVNMLLTFVIIFAVIIIMHIQIAPVILLLPLIIFLQFVMVLGFSILVSAVTVYFRDLEHICNIFLMVWMYLTPVFYPLDYVPKEYLGIYTLNPAAVITISYRDILLNSRMPNMASLGWVLMFSIALLIISYLVFYRLQKRFAEEL